MRPCKFFPKAEYVPAIMAFLALPASCHAHQIGGSGLASGIVHPLSGLDHLMAMVAVGIIGTQIGGNAVLLLPAAFLSFMITGGVLAMAGIAIPFVEPGIAASVLVLGSTIALAKRMPFRWAVACVGAFAVFHGHAHGNELSLIAEPAAYVSGFVLATALLHTIGIAIGLSSKNSSWALTTLRYAGCGMSALGLTFLLSALFACLTNAGQLLACQ